MHAVWTWAAYLAANIAVTDIAYGHGGGLDAAGCHHVRKTGEYHCHRTPLPAAAVNERRSLAAPVGSSQPRESPVADPPRTEQPSTVTPRSVHSDLANCQAIADPAKRLWCYDELAARHKQ